jgi:hypothetical protein
MLLIAELIPNDHRTGPALPLLFDVNMMIQTPGGATFTMAQYRRWLKEAGFAAIRTIKSNLTPSPLILASKPQVIPRWFTRDAGAAGLSKSWPADTGIAP